MCSYVGKKPKKNTPFLLEYDTVEICLLPSLIRLNLKTEGNSYQADVTPPHKGQFLAPFLGGHGQVQQRLVPMWSIYLCILIVSWLLCHPALSTGI